MLEVLQEKAQIRRSRKALKAFGWSATSNFATRCLRKLIQPRALKIGDQVKSWDVRRTLEHIKHSLAPSASVLDLGAYCSEVPVALLRMGFQSLHGIDLNPNLVDMPAQDRIRYVQGDFTAMPYEACMFDAVTAISVIEHGLNPTALMSEVARVLKPGGVFVASFDYWPEKIDTGTTQFFGLSWLIFSENEVKQLLEVASQFGLEPLGPLNFTAKERPIQCVGFDYTFAWMALRKR